MRSDAMKLTKPGNVVLVDRYLCWLAINRYRLQCHSPFDQIFLNFAQESRPCIVFTQYLKQPVKKSVVPRGTRRFQPITVSLDLKHFACVDLATEKINQHDFSIDNGRQSRGLCAAFCRDSERACPRPFWVSLGIRTPNISTVDTAPFRYQFQFSWVDSGSTNAVAANAGAIGPDNRFSESND